MDTFVCLATEDATSRFATAVSHWPRTRAFFDKVDYTEFQYQFVRLELCWRRVKMSKKPYAFYVRTRPDSVWQAPLTLPTIDSVVVRVREIMLAPGEHVTQQQMSVQCTYAPGRNDGRDPYAAIARQSVIHGSAGRAGGCYLVDDQFAIVPRRHAQAYFIGGGADSTQRYEEASCTSFLHEASCSLLPMVGARLNGTGEFRLTERLQHHCTPVLVYPIPVHRGYREAAEREFAAQQFSRVREDRVCGPLNATRSPWAYNLRQPSFDSLA